MALIVLTLPFLLEVYGRLDLFGRSDSLIRKEAAMEPKFEGDSNHYNFPSEPSLGGNQKQRDIPKSSLLT